jgi:uncharacterized protein YqcC (DUF446 family)
MDKFCHQIADLLLEIEAEMRRIELWERQPPLPPALQSLVPFCHDTLRFEQWLQWGFLATMKQAVESDEEYPSSSDITPMAEYRFAQLSQPTAPLLRLIERFDHHINHQGQLR